ncbi:MAG: CTB family bacteriocin [Rivularia sp. (in: Bacteria)]|nr:CTB family bacteriocin [Rivularia sp. MS3]MBV6622758.1 CTB family bacteriocin [Rivularia sp. MS3]
MSNKIQETTMFVNLSEEQQEVIAGGNAGLSLQGLDNSLGQLGSPGIGKGKGKSPFSSTDFLAEAKNINTLSSSGPNGSVSGGQATVQVVKTSGFNSIGGLI